MPTAKDTEPEYKTETIKKIVKFNCFQWIRP